MKKLTQVGMGVKQGKTTLICNELLKLKDKKALIISTENYGSYYREKTNYEILFDHVALAGCDVIKYINYHGDKYDVILVDFYYIDSDLITLDDYNIFAVFQTPQI